MNYTKEQIRIGAEKAFILDLIVNKFPKGVVSYVADSFNLWDVVTKILPTIKSEILSRDGKLVIRPDSGDPVDIICGTKLAAYRNGIAGKNRTNWTNEDKGVIELLWDIFGGTINEQGYKVLDPHIGAIYGDSINLERQVEIYKRLEAKGFAATNIVLGVGSFTYVMLTRDSAGYAAKGSWFEVEDKTDSNCTNYITESCNTICDGCECKKSYNIYKDPITDDGHKRSLKGLLAVHRRPLNVEYNPGQYYVVQECTWEEEEGGLLRTIYENGQFFNIVTLSQIREQLLNQ